MIASPSPIELGPDLALARLLAMASTPSQLQLPALDNTFGAMLIGLILSTAYAFLQSLGVLL